MLFKNKVSLNFIIGGALFFLILALLLGLYYGSTRAIIFGLFMWLFVVAIMTAALLRSYPKYVDVHDDELILVSFLGTSRKLQFSQIEKVVIHPLPSEKKIPINFGPGGYIRIKSRREYILTREIALTIKAAYTKKIGNGPPS